MTAMMRVPRTRGAGSGLLLILLGAWGALIPFVGPYFHFAYTPDTAWTWTWGRFFLEVVPGVAAVLGAVAFGRAAVVGAGDAQRPAGDGGAWAKPGRAAKPEKAARQAKQAERAKPAAEQDGERPSRWPRLPAAR